MQIVLIRHAQSAPQSTTHQSSWDLTEHGELSCRTLANRLATLKVTHIYSSHELKAVKTAELTAQLMGIPHESRSGFEEQNNDGVGWFGSTDKFKNAVQKLFEQPTEAVFGPESAVDAALRFETTIKQIEKHHPSESTIAIATHGRVMTSFLQSHEAVDPVPFWRSLTFPDCVTITWPKVKVIGRHSFP